MGRGDRSVLGCIFRVNLPPIAVEFAGGNALLANSRADSTGRVRLCWCVAVDGGCRIAGHNVIEASTGGRWPCSACSASFFVHSVSR
jgi:hypothetical protein